MLKSFQGALPESLPNSLLLPPLQDPQSSQSDEEICHVESRAEDSENDNIEEMPLQFSVDEDDRADIDIPSNFILVRSRSPDSDDVVDFLSGERKKETSNFLVTNFVNSRNADNTKSSKIGIDNLSFEAEDSSTRVLSATKRQNNNAIESRNSGMRTPQGMELFKVPIYFQTIIEFVVGFPRLCSSYCRICRVFMNKHIGTLNSSIDHLD